MPSKIALIDHNQVTYRLSLRKLRRLGSLLTDSPDPPPEQHKYILAMDPGSVNFAWAVIRDDGVLVESGMVPVQMEHVTAWNINGAMSVIMGLMYQWKDKVEGIAIERYQTRMRASKNNETVNITIGMTIALAASLGISLKEIPMPANWKTWWNGGVKGAEPWVAYYAEAIPGPKTKTIHMKDAAGIGYWVFKKTDSSGKPALPPEM